MQFFQSAGYQTFAHAVFRVGVGAAFFTRGGQKLFGWFGGFDGSGSTANLMSMYGAAGVIEFTVGLLVIAGLFTRIAAFVAAGEMAAAYFIAHVAGGGLFWWGNRGELAMLFCFSMLALSAWGPGPLSVDAAMSKGRSSGGR